MFQPKKKIYLSPEQASMLRNNIATEIILLRSKAAANQGINKTMRCGFGCNENIYPQSQIGSLMGERPMQQQRRIFIPKPIMKPRKVYD